MIVFATVLLPSLAQAQGLADLVNPDDIMLRKPAQPAADQAAQKAAAAQAAAEALAAERKARAEAEAKAAAEAKARAEAEAKAAAELKARAEAEARAAAESKAREEAAATQRQAQDEAAELKRLQAQIAAEKKAREEAAARAAAAERAVVAAQKAQAEAEAARVQAEQRVQSEQAARAEAEAKAAVDRQAADAAIEQAQAAAREKAEAEKAKLAAEKKAERLANPDPDERPVVKEPKAKLEAPVTDDAAAEQTPAAEPATKQTVKTKKQLTGRPAVITADRTDYDRKEGVILFDRNVHLDDEQYQMHADRVFVFLSGTNDLKRIVALGSVSITNEAKTAACAKAVYSREQQRIVMYAENDQQPAWLRDAGSKEGDESEVAGRRITYWLDSGLFSVEGPVVRFHGMKGADSPKDLFNPTRAHKEKAVKAEDEGK